MLATRLAAEIPELAEVERLVIRDVFLEIFTELEDTFVDRLVMRL